MGGEESGGLPPTLMPAPRLLVAVIRPIWLLTVAFLLSVLGLVVLAFLVAWIGGGSFDNAYHGILLLPCTVVVFVLLVLRGRRKRRMLAALPPAEQGMRNASRMVVVGGVALVLAGLMTWTALMGGGSSPGMLYAAIGMFASGGMAAIGVGVKSRRQWRDRLR